MPVYISLINWTDQGRGKAASLPERTEQVANRVEAAGGRLIGSYLTMGRYDQVALVEAPDDAAAAALLLIIAGRGNAITETLRAFTMDETKDIVRRIGEIQPG